MNSISSRLTFWYALSVTVTAAFFIFIGQLQIRKKYEEGIDLLNRAEFVELLPRIDRFLKEGDENQAVSILKEHAELDASFFYFQLGRNHGLPIFTSGNLDGHQLPDTVHGHRQITVLDPFLGTIRVGEYSIYGYDLHVATSLHGLTALGKNFLRTSIIILSSIFLVSMGIGYWLSRVALKPIASIERTAAKISANNMTERIVFKDTGDEIAKLARLLNTMFDRLQSSFEQVQRFAADASHELKTPLALIRINNEELLNKLESSEEERAGLLESQLDLIDNLNRVIDDLLVLTKADAGALKLERTTRSCPTTLEDFAQDAKALCEDSGLEFELKNNFEGTAEFDVTWFRHLLFNLLSNSIKISPAGGLISLSSDKKNGLWSLTLEDEGPGIPEEMIEKVFDRFYHNAYTPVKKGSGLGLPICRSIAQLHGGNLTMKNRSDRSGVVAIITLPLND